MNPNAHLSTILILGEANRFQAYSHCICDCAKIAEEVGAVILTRIAEKNPTRQFIHRTMPFHHVPDSASLGTKL